MPDILLVQPPLRDFYFTAKRSIPYGLACIASVLRKSGFSVDILDGLATAKSRTIERPADMEYLEPFYGRPDISPFALFHHYRRYGYSFEHIGGKAKASGAFLIGISSLFTAYSEEALETARVIKHHYPDCKIVLGGHHPTNLPEAVMAEPAVDCVLRGEGEVSISELAARVRDNSGMAGVPGIVYRKRGGGLHVSPPAAMADPDDYPLPALDLVRHKFYRRKKRGAAVITASRGCPFKCSYCSVGAGGLPYRTKSVDRVMTEIDEAVNTVDAAFIDFEDENLSLNRKWFLDLMHRIQTRYGSGALELRAMNGLYPPSLDETVISAMKAAGFKTLNLSLGSTAEAQLKRFRRPDVRPGLANAIRSAAKNGLDAVCYIIVGAPGQDPLDSVDDLLYLADKPVLAGVSVFYPAPGSRDYAACEEKQILPEKFSLMRSSALPLEETRRHAATLLRLGRILNFMKSLTRNGEPFFPRQTPEKGSLPGNRTETGKILLKAFLQDGNIYGMTPGGEIFEHTISKPLTRDFIKKLPPIR